MSASEKYVDIFVECFGLENRDQAVGLEYQGVPAWDSVGHMTMIAELEDAFAITLDMDDVIDFDSFERGKTILGKYGVTIDG